MDHDIVGRGWAFPLQVDRQGRLSLVSGFDEISQAIQIILGTAVGERVMRPEFGSRLHELVFAPINEGTKARAHRYVKDALSMWEPRISLVKINVRDPFEKRAYRMQTPGVLSIEIEYEIKSTGDQRSLGLSFLSYSR